MREVLGRYRIERRLGEGGMGVVFAARDEELDRSVAIKVVKHAAENARDRLRREARAAAAFTHPGICQVYEIAEDAGELFVVMELLDGESLADRLTRGALPIPQAVSIALDVLGALQALHGRGFVHRDIKPSNIFLASHGAKLLDFGLARVPRHEADDQTVIAATLPGMLVGTPRYMAPEVLNAGAADARADLYAVGTVIFEMVSGKCAFDGSSIAEIIHAVTYDRPPVLGGSPAATAVDRVIHRTLSKRPDDRYATAAEMAADLRSVLDGMSSSDSGARVVTRFIALPFRVLRSDPDTDFLAFSLPDAIATSMSRFPSLIVRSSHTAARVATEAPDIRQVAKDADVDVVLLGTLMRAGSRIRVSAQLVEAPSGTVLCSQSSQVALGDVFELQDSLAQQIAESLAVPLTARETVSKRDVPVDSHAYQLYLRANRASHMATASDTTSWEIARDLYLECVASDPNYAPAWAGLGRIYRVMAKWSHTDNADNLARAESALHRALDLNPDLPLAHNQLAQHDLDLGRATEAMVRLISRARMHGADTELFTALVQACRYCGLLDASVAAHRQARRLDPRIVTGVGHTYFMLAEYERVVDPDVQMTPIPRCVALGMLGRVAEAVATARETEKRIQTRYRDLLASVRALFEGDAVESIRAARGFVDSGIRDPEAFYHLGRIFARCGERDDAMAMLVAAVDGGYYCATALARDPWLQPLHAHEQIRVLRQRTEHLVSTASTMFRESGGEAVLGVSR